MSATDAQHAGLKALAEAVLRRNRDSNTDAICPELLVALSRERNSATAVLKRAAAEACVGLYDYLTPAVLVDKLSPEDIEELDSSADPSPFLRSFAIALVWSELRKQGVAPPGWDQPATCARCGPVLLWASFSVAGCPWCWNRLRGLPVPKP